MTKQYTLSFPLLKRATLTLVAILFFGVSYAAAPSISYASPQVYTINTAITPLSPTNIGGAVPATIPGVSTLAGNGTIGSENGTGSEARFKSPHGIAVDAEGNVYVADQNNHKIRKITKEGVVTTFAGSGSQGSTNGTGTAASFKSPGGVAIDASGNIYVADVVNHKIRKITPLGIVSTFAGTGAVGAQDGAGNVATFKYPIGVAVDALGNVYVADDYNYKIRKITSAGVVSTLAGTGQMGSANGAGNVATFSAPKGVAVDANFNVYVADYGNHKIRKITPEGIVSTFAGSGGQNSFDGTSTNAGFKWPTDVATDAYGNVFVTDNYNHKIRKITPEGEVSTISGTNTSGSADGNLSTASFNEPLNIDVDQSGFLYVTDYINHKIRKIIPTGYTINRVLPAGLNFDAATGTISGTPTEISPNTLYIITAYNSIGSSSALLYLAVNQSAPAAQATNLTFSATGTNPQNITLKYNASATAQKYLVVRKASSAPTFVPTDGTEYSVGAQGDDQIVYVGTATSATDLNMSTGTYFYTVYAYNGSSTGTKYLTISPLIGNTSLANGNSLALSETTQASAASFPDAGVSVNFGNGTAGTNLTVTKTTQTPMSNFSGLPGVKGLSSLYFTITSTNPTPGNYSIIIDFSSLNLTEVQWNKFKVLKRSNGSAAWADVTTLGATIVNRQTDGVWGKITISGLSSFSQFAGGLEATTHTVTSALESAATTGTLKNLIAAAESGDFITFDVSAMGVNKIMLTSPVVVDKNLTIIGASGGIILDGSTTSRVIQISDDVVARLEYLKIQNGYDDVAYAGGVWNNGNLTMLNCVISDNKSVAFSGTGGILQYSAPTENQNDVLNLVNCTVTNNKGESTLDDGVGGLWLDAGISNIYSSIIYGNTGTADSDISTSSTLAKAYNSCIGNLSLITVTEGSGNISTNPLFVGTSINATHPYSLYSNSPCVNTGSNSYNFDLKDIRNQTRIQNTTIDMGAYEWTSGVDSNGTTTAIVTGNEHTIRIYFTNQKIVISGAENAEVTVFNQLGQQLFTGKTTNGMINRSFAKGIYIVKVDGKTSKVLVK